MLEDKTKTITASFDKREAADRVVEHLVQQHGLSRADVFVEAAGERNSIGTAESGGDAESAIGDDGRSDGAVAGLIRVSVVVAKGDVPAVRKAFTEAGALDSDIR
ncbi:hypothetical protein [Falsirhodobacter xinxiangensis]|uniref:hypothetical protein n=1 Tax=Falsirhodobacter xinxiangensis TaxID=2530049 RepID=UPI0010A9C565|nr:hypothetical protein [Rhodobacter xinxiangensis]